MQTNKPATKRINEIWTEIRRTFNGQTHSPEGLEIEILAIKRYLDELATKNN